MWVDYILTHFIFLVMPLGVQSAVWGPYLAPGMILSGPQMETFKNLIRGKILQIKIFYNEKYSVQHKVFVFNNQHFAFFKISNVYV